MPTPPPSNELAAIQNRINESLARAAEAIAILSRLRNPQSLWLLNGGF